MSSVKKVTVVVPAYNEEENIKVLVPQILATIPETYTKEVIIVNDGSSDETLENCKRLAGDFEEVRYLSFSRNFGHQSALKAGLDHATGDAVISMDADMQHPPEVIPRLLQEWENGYEVVITLRKDEGSISLFKRWTSGFFYSLMNRLSEIDIQKGSADFRLLDKKVVAVLKTIQDQNLFLRGLVPWMGFKHTSIEFEAPERFSGESKYSFLKMLSFAISGITSFSIKPLRMVALFGAVISMLSFIYGLYAIVIFFIDERAISGWASMVTSVVFIGGLQLLMLGVIGEYIGKMFMQLKNRPFYIIAEKGDNKPENG